MIKQKRKTAVLVPYKIINSEVFLYLQRRTKTAKLEPGYFNTFGGHLLTGEKPEEGMLREIEEEMDFFPANYEFFKTYELVNETKNVFILRVDENFEKIIKIKEGEYGRF